MGIFAIEYRYSRFVLLNSGTSSIGATSSEVSPYGEYGAGMQVKILLGQIAVYGSLLILFLLVCKKTPAAEG